ncbi:aminoglycoside phosphotransferase (APT) family kinase protein [Saccharothrix coeruleofusca]|uniref:phosphotransferase family protein n=1 Tax=Saccharothrix coeruleofusca TaxID=33919 RepID=UPI001AEA65E2|nr:aminoglycoside phosphotransferase family protein [Saccharothrix coeruleofusca]MBP2334518.1 aminoglycoside phosphotransferase (APT) family kinase protein [Saccharothrix coeruleofusca]
MVDSLTKRRLTTAELDAVTRRALGAPLAEHVELTDGMFSTAYRLTAADGRQAVLKAAPPPDVPLLTYERDLMRTEVLALRLMAARGLPVPEVLLAEDGLLVMTALRGEPWSAARERLTDDEHRALRRDLGAITREMHGITGEVFGYPQGPNAPTWREAFPAMVEAVLADAERFGVALPEVRPAIAAGAPALDEVTTPALVHFDLWEGNVFLLDGRIEGVIDPERALFGDPLAELATVCVFADLDEDFLAGYGLGEITGAMRTRITLYRVYLCLILIVEGVPRGYRGTEWDVHERFFREQLAVYLDLL